MNARALTAGQMLNDALQGPRRASRSGDDKAYDNLKFALYQRMLGQRWRVVQAANGGTTWYDDFTSDDLDAMDAALEGRLASSVLSTLDRAECEAALTVIDVAREELRAADDAYENRRSVGSYRGRL
jgi:hypothetical protein